MPSYKRHFLVCTNRRDDDAGMPSCARNGSAELAAALRRGRDANGLAATVFVTETRCLGVCPTAGATVVVYPEAVWYEAVNAADVPELVERHMVGGEPVERLRSRKWRLG
jgi:(2Fe-2S) ferredoxin